MRHLDSHTLSSVTERSGFKVGYRIHANTESFHDYLSVSLTLIDLPVIVVTNPTLSDTVTATGRTTATPYKK